MNVTVFCIILKVMKDKAISYYYKNRDKRMVYYLANRTREIIRRRRMRGGNIDAPIPAFGKRVLVPKEKCKQEVLNHYGKVCACCGEKSLYFLTLDHPKNNGKEHKGNGKNRYKGEALYRFLKKNDYPTGIQVLCFNCNIGKRNNKDICPHKNEEATQIS